MAKDLEGFADDEAKARFRENQEIARTARAVKAELADTKVLLSSADLRIKQLEDELSLFTAKPVSRPAWTVKPAKVRDNHATLLALFSDAHYGEVVDPKQMGGYNKYNLAIADQRTERFFRRTIRLASDYLAGVTYDGIVLALNGDLVSGTIHDELVESNELGTNETVLWAVPRLASGIELLLKKFGKVHVVSAPGNHGRDTKIPRYKGRSANNADTMIAHLVQQMLGVRDGLTFNIPKTLDADFSIYDHTFTMEHGDELKAMAGAPEIGVLGPLMRGTNRKKVARAAEGKTTTYCLWSHFHQLKPLPDAGFIANGSLKGFDEYARGRIFKPELPKQALLVVTPEYGITTTMPVFVSDRKAEGW